MSCVSLQRKQAASIASTAIELTVNRLTQNNPWGRDLLTVGVETTVSLIIAAFTLPWFISIPSVILLGCVASSFVGYKYDKYFR